MPERKAVFTDEDPKRLLRDEDVIIKRVFDFGSEIGYAAIVDTMPDNDLHVYAGVETVESAEVEFELFNVPNVQNERVADQSDIRRLHNFNDDEPHANGITIAATDTGIDTSHPLFEDRSVGFYDASGSGKGDDVGHGTAVLGQIAQFAPKADLEMVRMFGDQGKTGMEEVLSTYEYLFANSDRIDVVNMSWGTRRKVQKIDDLQNKLIEQGVRTVTAAGNTGGRGGSPATAENAFSAGACTTSGKLAPFSSYNKDHDNPDVTAVGVNNRLASAKNGSMGSELEGRWVKASGTSFASPVVAAAVARYIEDYDPKTVVSQFEETADRTPDTPGDGAGLLNYGRAITKGKKPKLEETNAKVWSLWRSQKDMMFIDADWIKNGKYTATLQSDDEEGVTIRFEERTGSGSN